MGNDTKTQKNWQLFLFGKWRSIRAKFLHAFLDIAGVALIILLSAMLTFFWLRENALIVAEQRGPMALAASNLAEGLQMSLADIRGWLLVPNPKFIENYHNAWKNKIWKNYDKLDELAKTFENQEVTQTLANIKLKLIRLYNTQWQILDIAHTVGNNKASRTIYLKLQPIILDLQGLINGLRDIQRRTNLSNNVVGLRLLEQLENQLALSLKDLQIYSISAMNNHYLSFTQNIHLAQQSLNDFVKWQENKKLSPWNEQEQSSLLYFIKLELKAFNTIANETANLVKSHDIDIARKVQRQSAIPLERQISSVLQLIMVNQQHAMSMDTKQLTWIGKVTPWVMSILVAILLLIAVVLAILSAATLVNPITNLSLATQKLAEHKLKKDIPVPSEDELGQLTISFNQMRASLQASEEQTERLLLNILPASIVKRLRAGEELIADKFEDVSILFLDIVNFTPLAAKLKPEELVNLLSHMFTRFDKLVEQQKLEKIKTIGDAYMVAGGVPTSDPDHLKHMIEFGLSVLKIMPEFNQKFKTDLHVRLGLHCGVVIAGVLGQKRFSYDLWGDNVNIASRMESHGVVDKIQVSEQVYRRMRKEYDFEPRGKIAIKGIEEKQSVYLLGYTQT